MPDLRLFLLIPVGFVAMGLFFAWLGLRSRRAIKSFKARAQRTNGEVTELRRHYSRSSTSDGADGPVFHPVVRFALPDGREVEAESLSGSNPAPAKVGATVEVLYDPADPTRFRLEGFWVDGTVVHVIFVVLGLSFAGIGLAALVVAGLIAAR